ncbi:MAG TPA: hypothetical protein VF733_06420 [Candidatus Saccharimonadales bacterium]
MSGYISVSEIQSRQETDREGFLEWNINLPSHVDQERLQIHEGRVKLIGRFAGFGGVTVSEYQGNVTTYDAPAIGGIFNDGTAAAAGTAAATEAKRERSMLQYDGPVLAQNYLWPQATVSINRAEVGSRVATHVRNGHDDQKAWAYELNASLQRGLRSAAKQNIYDKNDPTDVFGSSMTATALIVGSLPPVNTLSIFPLTIATIYWGIQYRVESLINNTSMENPPRFIDRRWSIFPSVSFNPDRYALASLVTTLPLVRHRSK